MKFICLFLHHKRIVYLFKMANHRDRLIMHNGVFNPTYNDLRSAGVLTFDGRMRTSMFSHNKHLTKIIIPHGVTGIEPALSDGVFQSCVGLEEVVFPLTVVKIGRRTFKGCRKLEKLELPAHLTLIQIEAFQGCSGLQQITVPETMVSDLEIIFCDSRNLKTLIVTTSAVPTTMVAISEAFDWCFASIVQLHAPDHIVAALGGVFEPYKTFNELPATRRVSATGARLARDELYLWWTPSWPNGRKPSAGRRAVVKTLLTLAIRKRAEGRTIAATTGEIPFFMCAYMWLHVLGFVKHKEFMV